MLKNITNEFDIVIGIEVHCQLATKGKIFSQASNKFGTPPNHNIDPTCVGLPGALPVLNTQCVTLALRMALATHCTIHPVSLFARKNYFYPDLPKGYQITQLDYPLCSEGYVQLESGKRIGIDRIQLEEDAGKNMHVGTASLVDYNRSGVGLIEIVSHPQLSSPEEVTEYLKKLHNFAVHLEISDGNMEQGNFRADANVSLKKKGAQKLGQRTEIKNVNSFKYLEKAVVYEIFRQAEILRAGGTIVQETRGYDSDTDSTFSQRSKEHAQDYRYFTEPDLPPLKVPTQWVEYVKKHMPELPEQRQERYQTTMGLSSYDAQLIASWKEGSQYFESLVKNLKDKVTPKSICNFYMGDLLHWVKVKSEAMGKAPSDITEIPYPLQWSEELLLLMHSGQISGRTAKDVFEESAHGNVAPTEVVKSKGLTQINDESALQILVAEVLKENPGQLASYLSGKDKLFGFFVGQCMKKSQGQANPALLNAVLQRCLNKENLQREGS